MLKFKIIIKRRTIEEEIGKRKMLKIKLINISNE